MPAGEVSDGRLSDEGEFARALSRMVRWGLDRRVADSVGPQAESPPHPTAWHATGQAWDERAARARAEGRRATAAEWSRQAFFCHRLAEGRYVQDCAAKQEAYAASLASFDHAAAHREPELRRVSIPFEGHDLPGLLLLPSATPPSPVPAVLVLFGADGNKEEHLWASLLPYAERGVAALVVDCPGHGWARRVAGLPAIHDMERFTTSCVDVLAAQPEIDASRIGVAGSSLGGYYAPRSFVADNRLRACVVNSAVFDVAEGFWDSFPSIRAQLQYLVGAATPEAARRHYEAFTLDGVAETDRPIGIFHGAKDRMIPASEAVRLASALGPAATLVLWPEGSHNLGNVGVEAHPAVWDWIVDRLRN